MALSIKDRETEQMVRELAGRRGTGVTRTIKDAVLAELKRTRNEGADDEWWKAIGEIQARSCALPVVDPENA